MHPKLRNILTKTPNIGALSAVVQRMSSSMCSMFRNLWQKANDMSAMSNDMIAASHDMRTGSQDLIAMSNDIRSKSNDMIAMSEDNGAMSGNTSAGSRNNSAMSKNPFARLTGMSAKVQDLMHTWKQWRLEARERKQLRYAEFDELFNIACEPAPSIFRSRYMGPPPALPEHHHPLLSFLYVDKLLRRHTRALLAILLAFVRIVLGLTERTSVRMLPYALAAPCGSGRSPLGPRPPPCLYP